MYKYIKGFVLIFFLGTFVFLSPRLLTAGGKLQERMKQKIDNSKNIQYNLDVVGQQQYEPYYSSQTEGAEREEEGARREFKDRDRTAPQKAVLSSIAVNAPASSEMQLDNIILSSYAVYKTNYDAEIEEDVVTVKGKVLFEVFRKGWTQIPLVRSNVGLIDVSINRGTSFVTMQGGKYFLMIDKPGRYELEIEFLIKAARERESGPGNFSFEIMSAPISQFEFTMPEIGVDIFVEPAIKTEVKKERDKTIAWAVMPNTNSITVRWTKALPKETITPVKLEPKVYVDTATYASIGEGIIRCQTNLNYSILQSEVSNFRIALPEDVSILEVRGNDLRDWKDSNEKGTQYLDVYLNFGMKGNYVLNLSYERKIGEGSVVASIPWVRAMGVEREKGYFGLAASTNVELEVNKSEHVTLIDVKELPATIWSSTTNPILLAFKYLNHPFSIAIGVTRHEELPVLVAAIDSVDYVTLQTEEGKSLTKAIYQVRNNVKQFVRLILPNNSTLWSVFVAGKPVKPAKDKNGSVLIPLEKSQLRGENLTQFPVEIVYLDQVPKMGFFGGLKLSLPRTDIPISELNWSVYLPSDYAYFNFGGDVKQTKEERRALTSFMRRGVQGRLRQAADEVGTQYSSQYDQQYSPTQIISQEVQSTQTKGLLPIRIGVPGQGHLFRFSKLLVTEKDSPWLSFGFITVFRQVHGVIRLLILILILVLVVKFIKKRSKK